MRFLSSDNAKVLYRQLICTIAKTLNIEPPFDELRKLCILAINAPSHSRFVLSHPRVPPLPLPLPSTYAPNKLLLIHPASLTACCPQLFKFRDRRGNLRQRRHVQPRRRQTMPFAVATSVLLSFNPFAPSAPPPVEAPPAQPRRKLLGASSSSCLPALSSSW